MKLTIVTAEHEGYEEKDDKWWKSQPEWEGIEVPLTDRVVHHRVAVHDSTINPCKSEDPPEHYYHKKSHEDIVDKVSVDLAVSLERLFGYQDDVVKIAQDSANEKPWSEDVFTITISCTNIDHYVRDNKEEAPQDGNKDVLENSATERTGIIFFIIQLISLIPRIVRQ